MRGWILFIIILIIINVILAYFILGPCKFAQPFTHNQCQQGEIL